MAFKTREDIYKWFNVDQEYLWVVKFLDKERGPKAPFAEDIPALDVKLGLATSNIETKQVANTEIDLPLNTASETMSITTYDDDQLSLVTWYEELIKKTTFGKKLGTVAPLKNVVIAFKVMKFDRTGKVTKTYDRLVVPSGNIEFSGNGASSDARQVVLEFKVVGE